MCSLSAVSSRLSNEAAAVKCCFKPKLAKFKKKKEKTLWGFPLGCGNILIKVKAWCGLQIEFWSEMEAARCWWVAVGGGAGVHSLKVKHSHLSCQWSERESGWERIGFPFDVSAGSPDALRIHRVPLCGLLVPFQARCLFSLFHTRILIHFIVLSFFSAMLTVV